PSSSWDILPSSQASFDGCLNRKSTKIPQFRLDAGLVPISALGVDDEALRKLGRGITIWSIADGTGRTLAAVLDQEILQASGYFATVSTALAKLDLFGNVARPAFGGVEGHDPNRFLILPVEQVFDQRLAVSIHFVGLAPDPAENAQMVQYEIDVAVGILG